MYLEDRTVRLQLWDTAGQEYVALAIELPALCVTLLYPVAA